MSVHKRFTNQMVANLSPNEEHQSKNHIYQDINEKKPTTSFSKLIGNQREIIIALYKNMRINKANATEELTLGIISNLAGVNQKSLKNTLFRLASAGVISRADQKVGRGGWVKYQIHSSIINEIQQNEFLTSLKIKK